MRVISVVALNRSVAIHKPLLGSRIFNRLLQRQFRYSSEHPGVIFNVFLIEHQSCPRYLFCVVTFSCTLGNVLIL